MANHALLNSDTHKNLKVDTRFDAEFGDDQSAVITFPTEFADIQRHYPILLQKDAKTGEFQAVTLLGLEANENLFLRDGHWQGYVPAIVARGPFLIGFQEKEVDGEVRREPVIHIDLDDPRVNESEGEAVFLANGANSAYLERVATILKGIHEGLNYGRAMYAAFAELALIEPVNLDIKVDAENQFHLNNFYTVSAEKLAQLDGETLAKLNRAGFLEAAFLIKSSLANVKALIEAKRERVSR